jgi:GTP-binding protein
VVRVGEYGSFVLADIPGLIEGASTGKGLGFDFLAHIERTRVLVYMIDSISEHPRDDLKVLKAELRKWNPDLLKRPSLIVLSRSDLRRDAAPKGPWKLCISSATRDGLDALVDRLWKLLQEAPVPTVFRPPADRRTRRQERSDR